MDVTEPLKEVSQQGPLFALMVAILIAAGWYIKSSLAKQEVRENAREVKYDALVNQLIQITTKQVESVAGIAARATAVIERVEKKLNGE